MSAHPSLRAMATAATRERVRSAIRRISAVSLEPNARIGTLLVYGPPGYQASAVLRECLQELGGTGSAAQGQDQDQSQDQGLEPWTMLVGVADERERDVDWSFIEVLNQSLAEFGAHVDAPGITPGIPDDPAVVGRAIAAAYAAIGGPICSVVEQLHAADDKSAAAVRFGVRRHQGQKRMLLMSTDSLANESSQLMLELAQSRPEHNVLLRLPALSAADVQEIALELIGRPVSARVARRIVDDTEGNPTLVAGLIDEYRAELQTTFHPAMFELYRGSRVPLLAPQQRALDSASLGARTAAEVVAVLREPTAIATVNRIAAWLGITSTFGAFDLEAAEQLGLVRLDASADLPSVAPPTPVAADRIATGIPIGRRRQIHEAAADVLTGPGVLRHRVGATTAEDTTLVADLIDAAQARAQAREPQQAMVFALTAVRLAAPGAEYERAMLFAGTLALRLHEHQRLFHLVEEYAALPASALRDVILADLEVLTGQPDSGLARARALVSSGGGSAADSARDRALRAHAAVMVPLYDSVTGQSERVREDSAAARRIVAAPPPDVAQLERDLRWIVRPAEHELTLTAWELAAAARGRDAARISERMAHLEQLLRQAPDSGALVDATVFQARTLAYAGRVTDASNRLARAIRVGASHPDAWLRHTAFTMHAHLQFLTGAWDGALASARLAVDHALDDPYRASLPIAFGVSGLVPAARGDAEAVAQVERMLALLPPGPGGVIPYDPDLVDVMRAELAAATGDAHAQLHATEAARAAERPGTVWSWLQLHVDALAALGHVSEASAIASEALSGRTPWNRTPHAVSRLEARVALARGDLDRAAELYAGLARSHTAAGQPFDLARDRMRYAEALRARGETAVSIGQLELAASAFRILGARPYLERTRASLSALGPSGGSAREAREAPGERGIALPVGADPLAALSRREREVAIAVASGLTNREIAAQLFIAVTTVNFHVRNILAKLALSSRRELRAIVDR